MAWCDTMDVRTARQLVLVAGYYRCQNCGRDVDRLNRERRFRICDQCYAAIVTPARPGERLRPEYGDELWQAREHYWQWMERMERRYPTAPGRHQSAVPVPRTLDSYYPWCECGRPRQSMAMVLSNGHQPGLWGGPFHVLCADCEGRLTVRNLYKMAPRLVPGRDEEEWLDLLLRTHPELFTAGILPDYWFELKLGVIDEHSH